MCTLCLILFLIKYVWFVLYYGCLSHWWPLSIVNSGGKHIQISDYTDTCSHIIYTPFKQSIVFHQKMQQKHLQHFLLININIQYTIVISTILLQ